MSNLTQERHFSQYLSENRQRLNEIHSLTLYAVALSNESKQCEMQLEFP